FAKQLQHQSFELGGRQLIEVGGRGHAQVESNRPASGQAKNQPPPGLLPRLRSSDPGDSRQDVSASGHPHKGMAQDTPFGQTTRMRVLEEYFAQADAVD